MDKEEILKTLEKFKGTNLYHKFNGNRLLLTDGCYYLREACDCYWLFDLIFSYQLQLNDQLFQVWLLTKMFDGSWLVTCTDGNKNQLVEQRIEFSDFPLGKIEIWFEKGIVLLPSEY